MRSTVQEGQQRRPSISGTGASLSVVVVSSGSALIAQRAAQALKTASADFNAQFILVSQENDPALASSVERSGAEFVKAPAGSSRAGMCDLGMMRANGSIVVVRDDSAVGDAAWLDAYRRVIPRRDPAVVAVPVESVVMDTQVAGRASLADVVAFSSLESGGDSSIEMVAAV